MSEHIELTGNPAHVLAAIAKARGEPIDDAIVQQLAELCDEEVWPQLSVGLANALTMERIAMNELDKEFLLKLAALCEEYAATFGYTTDDDGIHIFVDNGREVFVGFMLDPAALRREAFGG